MKTLRSRTKRPRSVKKRGKPSVVGAQKKVRTKPSSLPPDEHAYEAGRAALALPHKTFEAWVMVGKAIQLLRLKADRIGTGKAFARLLDHHGFEELDRGTCSRLLRIMEHFDAVAAWHAGLPPKQQRAWAHPSTVCLHCFGKKAEGGTPAKSLTPLEAFEAWKKTAPKEFLDAVARGDKQLQQCVIDWLNELARAGNPAALSRRKFGSAEGGSRLHPNFEKALSNLRAPVRRNNAGATKPAFAADVIEQLRTILMPVRERFSFVFTMEKWADLVRGDSQEFADLIQNVKRARGRPKDETVRLAALLLAVIFEEFTGTLPGRSNQLIDTDDTRDSDKGSRFYKFCRRACDAIDIDTTDMAFRGAIAELKGRGKLGANFLALRIGLFRGLPMTTADHEQVRFHFSMALDAVVEGKLPSDVLSPGPPPITVGGALIDAAVHLLEQEDVRLAEFALRVLRSH